MQPRAEEFLHLLNQIDEYLKQRVKRHEGRGFMMRLDIAARQDPVLQRFKEELREFSELRNAIVHYRDFPASVIAEPTEEALDRLRQIVEQILDPPKLIPTFAGAVRCFRPDEPLREAMGFMNNKGYSQLPVYDGAQMFLLTTDGIARWTLAQPEACIDFSTRKVADVLPLEKPGIFRLQRGDATVESARRAFHEALAKGIKLRAILITRDSQPADKLLGIITASDVLQETGGG
jgi:predicted transcriptional regulator